MNANKDRACYKVINLCIERNWFDCGCQEQYNKMFSMIHNGSSVHDIAIAIYICSDEENVSLNEIEDQLLKII